MLRRYLESALLTTFATRRLIKAVGFSSAVFTHGIYVPWGLVGEVARQERVSVSTWNVAYRKRRFIFSHDDTYHHTLMTEPTSQWEGHELTAAQERELMQYLASRREGMFDWIVFHRPTTQDAPDIATTIGLDRRPSGDRPADERVVGRAAALPGQRVPEHARVAGPDVPVLRDAARSAAARSGPSRGDQRIPALAAADPR